MTRFWAIMVFLCFHGFASAQSQPPFHGTGAFRNLLALSGMTPLESFEQLFVEEQQKHILIIFGDPNPNTSMYATRVGKLREFVERGGAILVASDSDTRKMTALPLGVWVEGPKLKAPENNPAVAFRESLNCPFVQPSKSSPDRSDLFQVAFRRIATNNPSFLRYKGGGAGFGPIPTMKTVAILPNGCTGLDEAGLTRNAPTPTMFMAAANHGSGRFLVIADHSIFINGMIMATAENDNLAFSRDVLEWLSDKGKRTEVLFLDGDIIQSHFDPNPANIDPPLPHPDILMPAIDQMIISLEHDNAINDLIGRMITPYRLFRYVLLGLTGLLLAWGLYRITAGKLRLSSTTMRLPTRVEELADPAIPSARRSRDRALGDLAEPARELARRCLEELNVPTDADTSQPTITATGLFGHRHWSHRIEWLRSVASGDGSSWSQDQLLKLGREIDAIRSAVSTGALHIESAEPI